jgi:hypothetical protein
MSNILQPDFGPDGPSSAEVQYPVHIPEADFDALIADCSDHEARLKEVVHYWRWAYHQQAGPIAAGYVNLLRDSMHPSIDPRTLSACYEDDLNDIRRDPTLLPLMIKVYKVDPEAPKESKPLVNQPASYIGSEENFDFSQEQVGPPIGPPRGLTPGEQAVKARAYGLDSRVTQGLRIVGLVAERETGEYAASLSANTASIQARDIPDDMTVDAEILQPADVPTPTAPEAIQQPQPFVPSSLSQRPWGQNGRNTYLGS